MQRFAAATGPTDPWTNRAGNARFSHAAQRYSPCRKRWLSPSPTLQQRRWQKGPLTLRTSGPNGPARVETENQRGVVQTRPESSAGIDTECCGDPHLRGRACTKPMASGSTLDWSTVGLGPTKTIELRGGPRDGQRVAVPEGTTELQTPASGSAGLGIYRPSQERAPDGIEVWDAVEQWNDKGIGVR